MSVMTMSASRRLALGSLAALSIVLAACSAAATPSPAATSGAAAGPIATSTSSLGTFLVGPNGMTLYIRTKDGTNNQSSCTGSCASSWPPLTVSAGTTPTAASGVTGTLATLARADGTTQVSYMGRALYYFGSDSKPGDTTGQDTGGVWFVALVGGNASSVSGSPAAPSAAAPAGASAPPSKGGYSY